MKVQLKDNVYYQNFQTKELLYKKIIKMVFDGNVFDIMHKGHPYDLRYRDYKKFLYNDYTLRKDVEKTKSRWKSIVKKDKYCLVYKKED